MLARQDHRHAVVDRFQQVIGGRSDDRKSAQQIARRLFPRFPQAGHRKRFARLQRDAHGNLAIRGFLPFVEPVCQHQAAAFLERRAKGGFLGQRLAAGVNHAAADGGILSPERHQSPAQQLDVTFVLVENHRQVLRRCGVVARLKPLFRQAGIEAFRQSFRVSKDRKSSTHRTPPGYPQSHRCSDCTPERRRCQLKAPGLPQSPACWPHATRPRQYARALSVAAPHTPPNIQCTLPSKPATV